MDRSSFNLVESTKELEKRQAFKAKLADKIDSPQPQELPVIDDTFNGVSPGGTLVHPSLGEGILVEVDHSNNELLINFGSKGLIGLVLSQAKSFVHAPLSPEIKIMDDPFLGEEITRPILDRSDALYRPTKETINKDVKEYVDPKIVSIKEGSKVYHKQLGECIVISLDKSSNEISLNSDRYGIVNLVFSQVVRSSLSPIEDIRQEAKVIDDPFLGSEIIRDGVIRPDATQRELNVSKVVSSDFIEPEKTFIPIGSSVWHPDLGVCSVLSVDEKNNSLTLSTSNAVVDMVLSQVRSKLRTIETPIEHVPMQPLVRDFLAPRVPQYKSRGDVLVSLPEVFKTWQKSQQFMFLTRNQKLTTEQANDVFSVVDGNKPLFHSVTLNWQSQEEIQTSTIPGPTKTLSITEAKVYPSIFDNKNLWHPDFGECSVSSIEGNQLILMTSVGQVPCVLDATVPKLAVLDTATAKVEHVPKRLGTKAPAPAVIKNETQPKIPLILPNQFNSWKKLEQYQYLTGNRHLTPEDANAFLVGSADKFKLEWTEELPEANKRSEFKQQLSARVEKARIEPAPPIIRIPVDPGIRRVIEEVSMVKKSIRKEVPINLPIDFKNWTSSGQYVFLTRTKQLTFNEANDIMDILKGKSINPGTEYSITWDGSPIVQTPIGQREIKETTKEIVEKKNVVKKVSVSLPSIFKNWASSGQFGFLTRSRQLTFDEANDVLAVLKGNQPQNNKIEYEIVWSE